MQSPKQLFLVGTLATSILSSLFALPSPASAPSKAKVVVGVNVLSVNFMNEQQQDDLIEQLRKNGVNTVRLGLDERYHNFITKASQRGIKTVGIIAPFHGASGQNIRKADPSHHFTWKQEALSDCNPVEFGKWCKDEMDTLDKSGVKLAALELGNELNNAQFNGDMTATTIGRCLGLDDLNNHEDKGAAPIAKGFKIYVKLAEELMKARDASKLNKKTPIISCGMAATGKPRATPGSIDSVSSESAIYFMKQYGLDKVVDAYGQHEYPTEKDPKTILEKRTAFLEQQLFAPAKPGSDKTIWITEWGFTNPQPCPTDDKPRRQLVQAERTLYKKYAREGRLGGIIYFSWAGDSHTGEKGSCIYRCGRLTAAGKNALLTMDQ